MNFYTVVGTVLGMGMAAGQSLRSAAIPVKVSSEFLTFTQTPDFSDACAYGETCVYSPYEITSLYSTSVPIELVAVNYNSQGCTPLIVNSNCPEVLSNGQSCQFDLQVSPNDVDTVAGLINGEVDVILEVQGSHKSTFQIQVSGNVTSAPSVSPTIMTGQPSGAPSEASKSPTGVPSLWSTDWPTGMPTYSWSNYPTSVPSSRSSQPSGAPSAESEYPTGAPSVLLTDWPSGSPSEASEHPTGVPSVLLTGWPSGMPTFDLTGFPTSDPTFALTSNAPSFEPTGEPSNWPTGWPSGNPSGSWTDIPSAYSTASPSRLAPTNVDTVAPTANVTNHTNTDDDADVNTDDASPQDEKTWCETNPAACQSLEFGLPSFLLVGIAIAAGYVYYRGSKAANNEMDVVLLTEQTDFRPDSQGSSNSVDGGQLDLSRLSSTGRKDESSCRIC